MKQLLFDFFDGKTTSMQRKLVEEWLADENNQDTYYKYLDEWETAHPQFEPDAESALQHFQANLAGVTSSTAQPEADNVEHNAILIPFLNLSKWKWAAAACFLIASCFVFKKQILYRSLESVIGKTASYQLSEGTRVVLNSNSTLLVPRFGFGSGSREVFLDGEAEFKVTHTPHNDRFIVHIGENYEIEVLGTEFVAFSRARGKRVFLKNGKVKLKLPEGKQLYMKPGNLFVSDKTGAFNLTKEADPRPYTAWKDQTFYFDNTLLSQVALQIHEQFNVNVRIPDTLLANRRIAGTYKATQADDLLQILSELMQIEITQKEDYIELSTPKIP
ncbi:FecR family protein [Dyadobacter luticola]|nr:FecR domain-containing protein [Dyadobacter luticola]